MTEKWDTYHYIPLFSSLKQLLIDDTVIEQIEQCSSRIRSDNKLSDFCDGTRFSSHELFSQDPYALQIIAYYDELEVCNPLGSHVKKHKVGIVLYTLGNIHPKYRSQLKMINLVLVATVPVIEKHGLDAVLKPFIQDLNSLCAEGLTVTHNGVSKIYKGALLTFLADNLAANDLGGFKKSFSFSFRCCRTCLVTKNTLSTKHSSEDCDLRNDSNHATHVSLLEGPTSSHYSTTYGINRRSALLDVNHFSLFEGGYHVI